MKNLLWIVPLVIHFAFLGQNIFRSFVKIDKLKIEQEIKAKQKKDIENLIVKYDEMIENINDQYYREKVARNQLQMVLPGEQIYRLIETK
ncbi:MULTISPECIES: septum formation initiator family protein [Cetobacterium]|jgi:cell division protein FtsB|uniref:Septum formation initiator family protein n=1 Tax=Candidatus Cetobacterium colombiensis TaxID=3073100 RepID=A0ABU4W8B4_9FUSO|nr:septum formation initiator family protein [Candidatus Cetobacterium colombiensis]MDX8335763.1 septum formation initiator family protein [Candidatus Cetobacterium colombiensis]